MSKQQKLRYKDATPQDTLTYIKEILSDVGVELCEHWNDESSIGTHSLRVTVNGTEMGTNGKGVTREFARASAYAEFMERYQNLLFDFCCVYSDTSYGFRHFEDERIMSAFELAALDNAFMRIFYKARGLSQDASLIEKVSALRIADKTEEYMLGEPNRYEVRPFYNITKKRVEYLPYVLGTLHCGSNGMCAGNSPEEAMVQGLSEIFERYVQKLTIKNRLCFPDVPDEVIAKYPSIETMYKKLKAVTGYYVAIKDCSMGGRFPVAALLISKEDSGLFGLKFGSHPDFGIAMERTLTEASQGLDVFQYAKGNDVDFNNTGVDDVINTYNSFKLGTANYPYQILGTEPDFEYAPIPDTSQMTNKEILDSMVRLVEREGFEVWARDVSYLGFPSYFMLVPGMSEIFELNDIHLRASNTRFYIAKYLNRPQFLNDRICRLLIGTLEFWSPSMLDNQMRNHYTYSVNFTFPGEEVGLGWLYLSSMCHIYLGDYEGAATRMRHLVFAIRTQAIDEQDEQRKNLTFYSAAYHYLTAMANMKDHEKAMAYLRVLFNRELCDRLDHLFCDNKQILIKQYPDHDVSDSEKCIRDRCCDYQVMLDLSRKLKKRQLENPINQESLSALFS
ncbi:MAG: YcaO-like family protein [Saccharofermentanales bacterium]|jgi:ribosomal protein S12 methylthiotransferase accessory factor YcaO